MILYNVFDTEPTAEQAYDFDCHIQLLPTSKTTQDEDGNDVVTALDNTVYISSTTSWAIPYQRITDNKWVYPVCPSSDVTYTTEEFSPLWVPSEE